MGFLSGSSTIVRFLATPPPSLDRERLCKSLNRRTFREHDEHGLPAAETFGWTAIHDPLVVHLEPSDVFFQQYVVLGFRYDKRTVPGKLATLERRRAEEARKKEQNLERLGRAVRREIKEEVAARLLMQALPSPRLFECAWNLETHALYFTGKSKAAREVFSTLFRECVGVMPVPMIPYLAAERLGLQGSVVDTFRGVEPSIFALERARELALAAAGGEP